MENTRVYQTPLLVLNVARGLVVHQKVIEKHLAEELPFMATENILMESVKRGGDRQELHERIRVHARAAGYQVKELGGKNDLPERIASDPAFRLDAGALEKMLDGSRYIGRAPSQVDEFLDREVQPILDANADELGAEADLRV